VIAAHRHDCEVQFLVHPEDVRVIGAFANDRIHGVRVELEVLWEPAQDALMRTDAPMFKEKVIEDSFDGHVGVGILAVYLRDVESTVLPANLTC